MLFQVNLHNIGPIDGRTDTSQWRTVWEEAAFLFASTPPTIRPDEVSDNAWTINVDFSDAIAFLQTIENVERDSDPFERRLAERRALGKHLLSAELRLLVEGPEGRFATDSARAVGKFLQHLFLAMNTALPGACRIWGHYDIGEDGAYAPPEISGDWLESAFVHAKDRGWPPLKQLSFPQCWAWMEAELPYHLEVAEEPHHRALLTLLRLCGRGMADTDMMLHLAQVFEAFFSDGREGLGAVLRTRLELVLGQPPTHQGWFNKFYAERSRIAHGSAGVLRPGSYAHDDHPGIVKYWNQYRVPLDEAIAVLIAILQDLVTHESHGYVFLQEALRVPRGSP